LSLGVLVLWLIGLIGACTNKKNDVPLASAIAKNFTF
jgi:hypothetical protein